jgi:hypothetical protein
MSFSMNCRRYSMSLLLFKRQSVSLATSTYGLTRCTLWPRRQLWACYFAHRYISDISDQLDLSDMSSRGADSGSQVMGIIMASACSEPKNVCSRGDNPPRNSKSNNAGIKVGGSILPIPLVSARMMSIYQLDGTIDAVIGRTDGELHNVSAPNTSLLGLPNPGPRKPG